MCIPHIYQQVDVYTIDKFNFTVKYYSEKKNALLILTTTWMMNLKIIILSERNQTKTFHYMITFISTSRKSKLIYCDTKQQVGGDLGGGARQETEMTKEHQET